MHREAPVVDEVAAADRAVGQVDRAAPVDPAATVLRTGIRIVRNDPIAPIRNEDRRGEPPA
jgi:hypothetical protein